VRESLHYSLASFHTRFTEMKVITRHSPYTRKPHRSAGSSCAGMLSPGMPSSRARTQPCSPKRSYPPSPASGGRGLPRLRRSRAVRSQLRYVGRHAEFKFGDWPRPSTRPYRKIPRISILLLDGTAASSRVTTSPNGEPLLPALDLFSALGFPDLYLTQSHHDRGVSSIAVRGHARREVHCVWYRVGRRCVLRP